jgi:hypothetical protein
MSEIQLRDTAQYTPETLSNLQSFAYLTAIQRIVLIEFIKGMQSDLIRTDTEIAEICGVSHETVSYCRHNAHFLSCLSQATKEFAKSEVPQYINKLKEIALKKGSVRAIDLLIRYTGDFIPTNRSENLNATIQTKANMNMNLSEAVTEFVAQLSDKGLSLDRIVEEVTTAYQSLRDQQRIA